MNYLKTRITYLGFFGLFNALDTVDYAILVKKLENYGINCTNLDWFGSYLKNRK